jgi:para-nitrobenzyl esterase
VYAPETQDPDAPPLPVIVYYPSGAFQWGAANDGESNAFSKAQAAGWKDVILVTINYRTGIFGFLASPGLSARSGDNSSGLFGIHDQTMGLKWIQKNIGAFGGDKDRVMIFGESAGATSMSLHLVMPESAGLFHAVAIDSGAFNQWTYRSWGDAMDDYNNISKAFGCDQSANDTACFLSKSKWDLLNVSDAYCKYTLYRSMDLRRKPSGAYLSPQMDLRRTQSGAYLSPQEYL